MAAIDTWTDEQVETAIRLLVDAEWLVLWYRNPDGHKGPLRDPVNWLSDVRTFLLEKA